jgi:serine/threonine protein kinase
MADISSTNDLSPGQLIAGQYRIISRIGEGGMGVVYRVEQVFLHKQFAMKTLHAKFSDKALRRFQKEAQTTSILQHPNIVYAHNFAVLDSGQPFFIMDLTEGETLEQMLKRKGALSLSETLEVFVPICSALTYAHKMGVIHRDIKPGNIIITQDVLHPGTMVPKLVDFGIAKMADAGMQDGLTRTGEVFGTPAYMSPEQCLGQSVDHRSDIYSLGCLIFEALTGAPPFAASTALANMMMHKSEPAPSLMQASLGKKFPAHVESALAKALAKSPVDRFQTCDQLAAALSNQPGGDKLAQKPGKEPAKDPSTPLLTKGKISLLLLGAAVSVGILCVLVPNLKSHKQSFQPTKVAENAHNNPPNTAATAPQPIVAAIGSTRLPQETGASYAVPASKTELPDFFSRVEGAGSSSAQRTFDFDSFRIGKIGISSPTDEHPTYEVATGSRSFPEHSHRFLKIQLMDLSRNKFSVLEKFRPDDLYGLQISGFADELSGAVAELDEQAYSKPVNLTLKDVSRLKALHQLSLDRVELRAVDLIDLQLNNLQQLDYLVFNDCGLDGQWLAPYSKTLSHLNTLELHQVSNLASILKQIGHSKKLVTLNVASDKRRRDTKYSIKDSDLAYMANFPNLYQLVLNYNSEITDEGIAHLVSLKHLADLQVNGCSLTPNVIDTLAKMKGLKSLYLVPSSDWTEADCARLRQALPRVAMKNPG